MEIVNACPIGCRYTGNLGDITYAASLANQVVSEEELGSGSVDKILGMMHVEEMTGSDLIPMQEGEAGLIEILIDGLMRVDDEDAQVNAYSTSIRVLNSELSSVSRERLIEVLTDSIRHGELPVTMTAIRCDLSCLLQNQAITLSLDSRMLIEMTLDEIA